MDKNKLKKEMLEAIFIKTGGRIENPQIAEICAEIALRNCSTPNVIGQSELLEIFIDFINKRHFNSFRLTKDEVETFLDSNCH